MLAINANQTIYHAKLLSQRQLVLGDPQSVPSQRFKAHLGRLGTGHVWQTCWYGGEVQFSCDSLRFAGRR